MKVRLGDYVKVRRGASPRPIDDPKYFGGKVGWVRIVDVTSSKKYLLKTEQYVSKIGESKSLRLNPGDFILTICATVGIPSILQIPACIHDGFVNLYDLEGIDKDYLYYYFQNTRNELINKAQPGTQINLNTGLIANHSIYLPPLPQQRKIAEILSTVDAQIEATEQLIAKYEMVKEGLIQDLFTRGIDINTGKLRPKYKDAPHLYKESPLGMIPKEWEVKKLKDISNKIIDGTHFTPTYTEFGVPFLRVTDIQREEINRDKTKYISPTEHLELTKRCKPEIGDILYSKNGTIGLTKVVDWNWRFSIFVSLCLIKLKVSEDPEYIANNLDADYVWKQIQIKSKQGTVTNLHLEEIRELEIKLPLLEEQNAISYKIKSLKENNLNHKKQLEAYQKLKQGLMQDLLSGRKEVITHEAEKVMAQVTEPERVYGKNSF